MKILALVTDAFGGHGGIAKFNRDLLTAMCLQPDVEQVVALPRLLATTPDALPAKLEYNVSGVGGKVRYALAVLKSAIANRHSGLIVCGHINLLPIAFLTRLFNRAPIVLVVHGIDAWQPTRSWLVNQLVRRVDAFIAVSELTRRRFLSWAGVASGASFVLPNCVDLKQFKPGAKSPALLARHGLQNRTVLLTVARLSAQERYKGIDEVLEVLPELAQDIPAVSYLIVGDGSDRERLEAKATELGVRDRVVFAGKVTEREKIEYYRLADAFVMPGWGEGFGIVYLEALASGVPALGSTLDASQEALRNGALGVLVNPRNRVDVLQGIIKVLQQPHGVVPAGLEYFSYEKFTQRCGEWLVGVTKMIR